MSLKRLNIRGISYSQTQNGAYALVLKEVDGSRQLPIVIGAFEAQSIAIALEKELSPPRPLTHDLFKTFAQRFSIVVKQVIIHKLVDGVFYSSLICERDKIEEIIDARTSDAIALAVRFKAPVFTYENILEEAGIQQHIEPDKKLEAEELDGEEIIEELINAAAQEMDDYSKFSIPELNKMLNEAVSNEDYELAAQIRDEISKR
ncbi:bifunctional nuclease family protein [uncultured Nonlabens sp.]|uniref:bifunctional nuclease family protein n=1 Tax=uncultured Nonlabens sp. TaxID=859306 RepID=UPI0026146723|nr:bifunctional nuclease family protein [uncultured Nonlabens sp.]